MLDTSLGNSQRTRLYESCAADNLLLMSRCALSSAIY